VYWGARFDIYDEWLRLGLVSLDLKAVRTWLKFCLQRVAGKDASTRNVVNPQVHGDIPINTNVILPVEVQQGHVRHRRQLCPTKAARLSDPCPRCAPRWRALPAY
jgi:hypothetical protein